MAARSLLSHTTQPWRGIVNARYTFAMGELPCRMRPQRSRRWHHDALDHDQVALRSLWADRMRSILAMLGIIIGVGAVIFVLSLVAAAKADMMGRINAMGTNLLVVSPGQRNRRRHVGYAAESHCRRRRGTAGEDPADPRPRARRARQRPGQADGEELGTSLMGTSVTYFPIRSFEVAKGRLFNDADCDAMSRVAVIGATTATDLFGTDEPCNQVIKLNSINFRVIGVLKSKGDQGWFNPDDQVLVPYTVAMKQIVGVDHLNEIDIRANNEADLDNIMDREPPSCCASAITSRKTRTTTSASATRRRCSRPPTA